MGIADRAYMRGRAPVGERLSATAWTLGILVGVFILGFISDAAYPVAKDEPPYFLRSAVFFKETPHFWALLTYALVHADFWHLLGNGLILWWTGEIVERQYGRRTFLALFAIGIFCGAATWYMTGLGSEEPRALLIGASAGVYTIMLVALLDKLEHQITLLLFFFLPVTLRVRWVLLITAGITFCGWVFSELPHRHDWSRWHPVWKSDIAHSAHLGGLLLGWLAFRWLNQTNLSVQGAQEEMDSPPPRAPEPDLARYDDEETAAVAPLTRQQARAELDTLLDKISAGGFGSLTAAEKRRLEDLSARLR